MVEHDGLRIEQLFHRLGRACPGLYELFQSVRGPSGRARGAARRFAMMEKRTGGCLCGAIRYEAGGEPLFSLQCHCRDCQRQSGTAYVAAVRMPSAEFRITKGTPKKYVAKSDAGNDIARVFCGDCGAPLYVQVSTRPDMVGIRVSSFDDPSFFE